MVVVFFENAAAERVQSYVSHDGSLDDKRFLQHGVLRQSCEHGKSMLSSGTQTLHTKTSCRNRGHKQLFPHILFVCRVLVVDENINFPFHSLRRVDITSTAIS